MTLELNLDRVQKRIEALFKKEERAREGAEAMLEYKADVCAVREKTARLRALRAARGRRRNSMRRVRGSHSISIERLSSTSISGALLDKSQGAGRTKQDRSHNGYPGRSLAMAPHAP